MVSITLVRTVSFSIYQRAKHSYANWVKQNLGFDIIRHVNKQGTYPNLYSVACFGAAGATAGSAITFLACPFELTKLSAQVSVLMAERAGSCARSRAMAASYQNKGTLRTMGNIIKNRGVWGLYTGLRLHLCKPPPMMFRTLILHKNWADQVAQYETPSGLASTSWYTKAENSSAPHSPATVATSWRLWLQEACADWSHGP
jgi:hypothetical protein